MVDDLIIGKKKGRASSIQVHCIVAMNTLHDFCHLLHLEPIGKVIPSIESVLPAIQSHKEKIVQGVDAYSRTRMPEVNHTLLIKILHIGRDDICLLD